MAKQLRQRNRREARESYAEWERKQEDMQRFNLERVQSKASGLYAGIDPRRRREIADAGMVQEDPNSVANLSPTPIHREYTRFGFYSTPYIDDTVD